MLANKPPHDDIPVVLPGGTVFLGRDSYDIDALTLGYVWGRRAFPVVCRDRIVLDLGGHKGYFGAWALAQGAVRVYSFEPQSGNHALLTRARDSNVRASAWHCERTAVGESSGTVKLFVSAESWAHSLHGGMIDAVAVEEVPMVTLPELLRRISGNHPAVPVGLKINVEGGAGDILFPATPEDLASVLEIVLDHEPGSPYDITKLLDHLAAAGLGDVTSVRGKLFTIRRTAVGDHAGVQPHH
jgi:FkbM family methyltransferase